MNTNSRSTWAVVGLMFVHLGVSLAGEAPTPMTPQLVVQTGHRDGVDFIMFSPDGRTLVSSGEDSRLIVWNVASGRELRTLEHHEAALSSAAFSPDGRTLALVGAVGSLKLWDVTTGKELLTLVDPNYLHKIISVAFSPNGRTLASGSEEHTIKLWDVATGRELRTLEGHTDRVNFVAFAPDGQTLVSASADQTVKLWDVPSGSVLRTLANRAEIVDLMAFAPDGQTLALGYFDHTLELWDVASGRRLRTLAGGTGGRNSVAFSPDGLTLASGSDDRTIKLWDVASGRAIRTLAGHAEAISSVAYSPDGRVLASSSLDHTIRLWDVASGEELRTLDGQAEAISSVAYSPDGRTLAVGSFDHTIKLWDLASGKEPRTLAGHAREVDSLAFSPDGQLVASGSDDRTIKLWDAASGKELRTLAGHTGAINSVAFSPDGQTLVSGSSDHTIKLWHVASGRELRTLTGHPDAVNSVAFSPNGRTLASGSSTAGVIKFWDVASGKKLRPLNNPEVLSLAFSRDGRILASAGYNLINLWDLASGKKLQTISAKNLFPISVALSPDGRTLASGGGLGNVELWDVASGKKLRTLAGHSAAVAAVAFSPDGQTLATAGTDSTSKIWRVADGALLVTLIAFRDGHWAVTDSVGRFDTADLEEMPYLNWVLPDDPFTPLPLEIFMRDYYEPRLLSRTMNGERLKPVRDLRSLNRIQPVVKIISAVAVAGQTNVVDISVEAVGISRRYQPDLPEVATAVHDLRVLRNGQLVGYSDGVLAQAGKEPYRKTFRVRLPTGNAAVHFTAYAFNDDRVKSNTAGLDYASSGSVPTTRPRAYVITVGVNQHQNTAWNLHYAANDARRMSESVVKRLRDQNLYQDIVPIVLISDTQQQFATKSNIEKVLDRLAGHSANVTDIPNGERLQTATPDDLVILSFSGHGFDEDGEFYLIPGDTGSGQGRTVTPDLRAHAISSNELADWWRDVDGGDMSMIIDACQSAASVGTEFKPGPMGASGLGQLAYEKGMRILAASQAEASAGESELTQQGLLSYALVHDGLDRGKADYKPVDGKITLAEWLAYGALRVPSLAKEVSLGVLDNRGAKSLAASYSRNPTLQQPALFDFTKNRRDAVIVSAVGSP